MKFQKTPTNTKINENIQGFFSQACPLSSIPSVSQALASNIPLFAVFVFLLDTASSRTVLHTKNMMVDDGDEVGNRALIALGQHCAARPAKGTQQTQWWWYMEGLFCCSLVRFPPLGNRRFYRRVPFLVIVFLFCSCMVLLFSCLTVRPFSRRPRSLRNIYEVSLSHPFRTDTRCKTI